MSRASEFAAKWKEFRAAEAPQSVRFPPHSEVWAAQLHASGYLELCGTMISQEEALALRDWITENFE